MQRPVRSVWNHPLLISLLMLVVPACSGTPGTVPASKPFTGTVHGADGKPVGTVLVHFHPTKPGYSCTAEVDAAGAFASEAPPGTYAYSVRRSEKAKPKDADAALKNVPPAYRETDLKRTVAISDGATVAIVLD